jgi:ribosomal protein S19
MPGLFRQPPQPQQRRKVIPTAAPLTGYPLLITTTSGLVGYWRLGETSGQVLDSSGQGNNGNPTALTRDVPGFVIDDDGAATFNGTTSKVEIPHDADHAVATTGQLSIEFWIKTTDTGGTFISKSDGVQFEWAIRSNGSGLFVNVFNGSGSAAGSLDTSGGAGIVNDDAPHHVVITIDEPNDVIRSYLDGAVGPFDATTWTRPSNESPSTSELHFGERGDGSFWAGTLDEVAIYNTVLSPAVILDHYQVGSGDFLITPTTVSLTLTTFAPTIRLGIVVPTRALTLTAFAPTVSVSDNQRVTPTTASLTTARFAPTVTASDHQRVTPTTAALVAATFAPTVSTPVLVTPTTAGLTLTTFAPTVTVGSGAGTTVTPGTASLTLSPFAPTVSTPTTVTPTTRALVLTTFAPVVSTPQTVTPGKASLTIAAFAPSVSTPVRVTPTTRALVLSTFAPTVSVTTNTRVTPAPASLVLAGFIPLVVTTGQGEGHGGRVGLVGGGRVGSVGGVTRSPVVVRRRPNDDDEVLELMPEEIY